MPSHASALEAAKSRGNERRTPNLERSRSRNPATASPKRSFDVRRWTFDVRRSILLLLISALAVLLPACKTDKEISDFTSDGCSLFPDQSLINSDDWCGCCVEHDIAYWQGGTEEQRLEADQALRDCVLKSTGDATLAEFMYQGVRFGGSPYFYNWYRWGYGWNYERKYRALSPEEQAMVQTKLDRYFASNPKSPCQGE